MSQTDFSTWSSDDELFRRMRERLYTPVVGDVLDTLGRVHQFLPQAIQPLRSSMQVVGRAMPVLMIDVYGPQSQPFGELTDTPQVLEQNWPVFSRGGFAQDSRVRTQAVDYRCAIEVGQVTVQPGDLIFGDQYPRIPKIRCALKPTDSRFPEAHEDSRPQKPLAGCGKRTNCGGGW